MKLITLTLGIFISFSFASYAQTNAYGEADKTVFSTIKIFTINKDGTAGFGTGFLFDFDSNTKDSLMKGFLVTAAHLVKGVDSIAMVVRTVGKKYNFMNNAELDTFFLAGINQIILFHPDPKVDLAIIPVSMILQSISGRDRRLAHNFLSFKDMVSADDLYSMTSIEELLIVGFPMGIESISMKLPIARRAITATPYNLARENGGKFFTDFPASPGCSGGPVFLRKLTSNLTYSYSLFGIHVEWFFQQVGNYQNGMNLGIALEAILLYDFIDVLKERGW